MHHPADGGDGSAPERPRIPRLPVRQWVLSVPKRLRYFMQRDGAVLSMVLRIFLRVIAQTLQTHSPGAAHMDKAGLHIGAIAFIHRFGSSLMNTSTSTFVWWTGCLRKWRARAMLMRPSNLIAGCHLSRGHRHRCGYRGPSADHTAKRILRAFVARGLLENCDAKDMLGYKHSGFSVDAGVCIEAHDRAGAGAVAALLRASTVFHGAPTQRGKQTGVPLRQTAQRAHQ